ASPPPPPEVAALDRVVEQPEHAVAVVLVVLRGVDAALRRDRGRAPRAPPAAEALDVVAQLGQRGGGGRAGQAGADHDQRVLPLVGRVDQLHLELVLLPPLLDGPGRRVLAELHGQFTTPVSTAIGNDRLPTTTITANAAAARLRSAS